MYDSADDGLEVRTIRREEIVRFADWVEIHIGETKSAKNNSWLATAWAHWILGLRKTSSEAAKVPLPAGNRA